jgi:nicotinate-nucleotide pyrophosphorylase (carboxylating)
MYNLPDIADTLAAALAEDLGVEPSRFLPSAAPSPDVLTRDVTSSSVVGLDAQFSGVVVAREACTVCGLPVAAAVFETLSGAAGLFEPVEFFPLVAEGARVAPGTPVAEVDGLAAAVLSAERTALDFLMVLSGIATQTARWVAAAGPDLAVCDTRKTLPGLRALSKYAVRVGGGVNHRAGLHDMVLIKDNHRRGAGNIATAVALARAAHPDLVIEVEADSLGQAREAVGSGADIVLLDNMDDVTLARAVQACREAADLRGRPVLTEASGTVTYERLAALRGTGVDRVSASALTLTAPVDFGLDET